MNHPTGNLRSIEHAQAQLPMPGTEDYLTVARAIEFITHNWRQQPPLKQIAAHVGMNETQFHKLFSRWAGMSPKEFIRTLTLQHARSLLTGPASVLDTAFEVGLSGPGRLHDLFVHYEAMTPGDYKAGGKGLSIAYGFHDSPFGIALAMATNRGLAGLAFCDGDEGARSRTLEDMKGRWPKAAFYHDQALTKQFVSRCFDQQNWSAEHPLKLVLIGSDFDVTVWETLLQVPFGRAVTYGEIASHIGKPKAARAVGSAVGRNPVSFVVPCHRALRASGAMGGYHWGLTRKHAIIGWESGLSS